MPLTNTNSNESLAVCTSVGFGSMTVDFYVDAASRLKPDIVLGPGDFVIGTKVSVKRSDKMGDRTTLWIREILAEKQKAEHISIFAPILPVPLEQQKWYLDALVDEFRDEIEGLYVMDAGSVIGLPESLNGLPRLAFTNPDGPGEVLRQISLGVDLFVLPFIGKATDGGIALDFVFPPPTKTEDPTRKAIGIDAWDNELSTDLSPLTTGCECYACTKHHRAYLHHLLSAKEMLAWVLLQIHNHHVLDQFFAGVKASIENGTFEEDKSAFERFYESELPVSKGLGPRIRGYQTKSMSSGESKKNPKAYNNLDHMARNLENNMADGLEESSTLDASAGAERLEEHGMGQTEK
ncbi:Cytokinesis protein [Venturia nashicola]|nr:Cytokinesis protein [Venturia nashicola]